ncbi:MAG: TIGR04255 family protein, partial [Mariprofundaceae bacterium]
MKKRSATISYNKPPIVEAIIGINFSNEIDATEIMSISKKFSKYYANNKRMKKFNVGVEIVGTPNDNPITNMHEKVFRNLSSDDMTQQLVIWPETFTISQRAPYSGWDGFFGRFVRDWKIWKRTNKHRTITRIGVRYINRIDIPATEEIIEHEGFLNIYPQVPDIISPLGAYSVTVTSKLDHIGCKIVISSEVVPCPLLNHNSFLVDQDIHIDSSVPQKDDDIYTLL